MKKILVITCIVAIAGGSWFAVLQNNEYQKQLNAIAASASNEKSTLRRDALLHGGLVAALKGQTQQALCELMSDAVVGVSKSDIRERMSADDLEESKFFQRYMDLRLKETNGSIAKIEAIELMSLSAKVRIGTARDQAHEAFLAAPVWKSNLDVREDIKRACA